MGETWTILSLKLKQYYGPLRASASAKAVAALTYLLMMGSAAGGAFLLQRFFGLPYLRAAGWLENSLATAFSALLAVGIYLGVKGGVTALKPEIDYVLTAAVKPSRYLLADLFFQLIFLNLSVTPGLGAFTLTLLHSAPPFQLLSALAAYEAILLLSSLLAHILGVAAAAGHGRLVKLIGWVLIVVLMAPALSFLLGAGLPYTALPLPSTLAAKAAASTASTPELLLLAGYMTLAVAAYLKALRIDFFADVKPLLATAFMDLRTGAQAERLRGSVRRLTRLTGMLRFRPERGSLGLMLVKLHLLRVLRDGSLFTALVFVGLFLAANLTLPPQPISQTRASAALITMMILYTPFIPSILLINWSISERPNLWATAITLNGLRRYMRSMLTAFTIISSAFSFTLLALLLARLGKDPFLTLDILLAFSAPLFSSSIAVASALRLPPPRHAFSPTSLLHIIIPTVGTILLTAPALTARTIQGFAENPHPFFTILYILYTLTTYMILTKLATNVEGIEWSE